jgi:hypothetical protein
VDRLEHVLDRGQAVDHDVDLARGQVDDLTLGGGRRLRDEFVVEGGLGRRALAGCGAAVEREDPVGVGREDELVGHGVAVGRTLGAGKLGGGHRGGVAELVEEVPEARALAEGTELTTRDREHEGCAVGRALDRLDLLLDRGRELLDLGLEAVDLTELRGALEARGGVERAAVGAGQVDGRRDLGQLVVLARAARGRDDQVGLELGDGLEVGLEERADLGQVSVLRQVVGQTDVGDAHDRVAGADRVERVERRDVEGHDRLGRERHLDRLACDLPILLEGGLAVLLDEGQRGPGVLDGDHLGGALGRGALLCGRAGGAPGQGEGGDDGQGCREQRAVGAHAVISW